MSARIDDLEQELERIDEEAACAECLEDLKRRVKELEGRPQIQINDDHVSVHD